MKKLIIKDKGHFMDFPGIPAFRTPVDIDVTKIKIERILVELKKHGIDDYNLIEDGEEIKMSENKVKKVVKKVKGFIEDTLNRKRFEQRMNKIESMLETLINRPAKNVTIISDGSEQPIIEDDLHEVGDFVPSININDMEIKGSALSSRKIESDEDFEETADALSELLKGK